MTGSRNSNSESLLGQVIDVLGKIIWWEPLIHFFLVIENNKTEAVTVVFNLLGFWEFIYYYEIAYVKRKEKMSLQKLSMK